MGPDIVFIFIVALGAAKILRESPGGHQCSRWDVLEPLLSFIPFGYTTSP